MKNRDRNIETYKYILSVTYIGNTAFEIIPYGLEDS